jgi:hypothetical protein
MLTALVAAGLSASLVGVSATTAEAADSVKIRKFGSYSVTKGHKTTIKAKIDARGNVRIGTPVMDVWNKKGKRIVVKKPRARLGAGTYKVRTTVKYRSYTIRNNYAQRVVARKGSSVDAVCTVTSVSPVVGTIVGPVDDVVTEIPVLGDLLGVVTGLVGNVLQGVINVHDYTATCKVGGSNGFRVSGTVAGSGSVDRSVVSYPGSEDRGLTDPAIVNYGPENLKGRSFTAKGLTLAADATQTYVKSRTTTYSPIKKKTRTQTVKIRRR